MSGRCMRAFSVSPVHVDIDWNIKYIATQYTPYYAAQYSISPDMDACDSADTC